MTFDREGTITVIFDKNIPIETFLIDLSNTYDTWKHDHIIVNLLWFEQLNSNGILGFLELSNKHRGAGKSFVLVTDKVTYDEVPDEICLAPTLQEAKDIIEMEEIERDLEL